MEKIDLKADAIKHIGYGAFGNADIYEKDFEYFQNLQGLLNPLFAQLYSDCLSPHKHSSKHKKMKGIKDI